MSHDQRRELLGPGPPAARRRAARAKWMARGLAALGLAALLATCGPRRVYVPGQTESAELTASDLALAYAHKANRAEGDFMEQVLIRGSLEGGGSLYGRLRISNVGPRADGDADLRVRLVTPDGERYAVTVKRKRGRWTWDRDRLGAALGESTVEATPRRLALHVTDGRTTIDVEVSNDVQPLRPEGGTKRFQGAGYYQTTVLVPRGELKVTVETAEEGPEGRAAPAEDVAEGQEAPRPAPAEEPEPRTWSGFAYAEHRASSLLPYEAARTWINAYHVDQERTFILSAFQTPPARGGEVRGWLFYADEDGALVYRPTLTVETAEATVHRRSGYAVPAVVKFQGAGGLVGALQATRSLGAKDELAGMSAMERFLVSKVTKPWSFPHEARYLLVVPEVDEAGAPVPGEGGQPGPAARYTGDTRYVFMRLN